MVDPYVNYKSGKRLARISEEMSAEGCLAHACNGKNLFKRDAFLKMVQNKQYGFLYTSISWSEMIDVEWFGSQDCQLIAATRPIAQFPWRWRYGERSVQYET